MNNNEEELNLTEGDTYAPDYVVDAFTKTGNDINIEVDNANIKCLTSKNNSFSLDENGNLVVNTITSNQNNTFNVLDAYPVGSIYLSTINTNPSDLFGGTWQAWGSGRCVVGVDTAQTEFNTVEKTGGEKTHTLKVAEIPAHNHTVSGGNHTHTYTGYINVTATTSATYQCIAHKRYAADGTNTPASMNSSGSHSHTVSNTGSGTAHNNLQPYITCYMWKRIS